MFKGEPQISMSPFSLVDSCVIDSSFMTVFYRFCRQDSAKTDRYAIIRMQIGQKIIKQTDLHLYFNCLTYSAADEIFKVNGRVREHKYTQALEKSGNSNSDLFFEQIQDRESGDVQTICGDYFVFDSPLSYREPALSAKWTPTEKTDTVTGQVCNTATATFRGRSWNVWYTTAIPVQCGPWKLSGLPGLILKAVDQTEQYSFIIEEIASNQAPIYKYGYNSLQDLKTRKRYMQYERSCHEHPYQTFTGGEQAIVMKNANGKMVNLDETWTIPYDPIELE